MRYPSPALLLASLLFFACESLLSAKEISLHDGWKLQSACKVADSGKAISSPGYRTSDWISASVPTTVLAAQVAAGIYKDIYYGTNLRSISGATYPIGENFSNLPMPADSPYHCAWWYRTDFSLPT